MLQLLNKECLLHNYFKRNTAVDQINEFMNFYLVLTWCQESCHPRLRLALRPSLSLMTSFTPSASSPTFHANNPQNTFSQPQSQLPTGHVCLDGPLPPKLNISQTRLTISLKPDSFPLFHI